MYYINYCVVRLYYSPILQNSSSEYKSFLYANISLVKYFEASYILSFLDLLEFYTCLFLYLIII